MVYFLAILLAFCSVCYELLLGQMLSAFLGNTVLRYSVTIGLYMASMGVGAFLVNKRLRQIPLVCLLSVEIALTVLGSGAIPLLFLLDYLGFPIWLFSFIAHSLIIFIGVLTGMEIPLLVELRRSQKEDDEGVVIGVDYLGAFIGTFAFAFYFYPEAGLIESAFFLAGLNGIAGLMLIMMEDRLRGNDKIFSRLLGTQFIILLTTGYCWSEANAITSHLLQLYLPS